MFLDVVNMGDTKLLSWELGFKEQPSAFVSYLTKIKHLSLALLPGSEIQSAHSYKCHLGYIPLREKKREKGPALSGKC